MTGKRDWDGTNLAYQVESLSGANVPFPVLFDLREYPRLDECSAGHHDTVHTIFVDGAPIILRREAISSTENGHGSHYGEGKIK